MWPWMVGSRSVAALRRLATFQTPRPATSTIVATELQASHSVCLSSGIFDDPTCNSRRLPVVPRQAPCPAEPEPDGGTATLKRPALAGGSRAVEAGRPARDGPRHSRSEECSARGRPGSRLLAPTTFSRKFSARSEKQTKWVCRLRALLGRDPIAVVDASPCWACSPRAASKRAGRASPGSVLLPAFRGAGCYWGAKFHPGCGSLWVPCRTSSPDRASPTRGSKFHEKLASRLVHQVDDVGARPVGAQLLRKL